jgi:hypothetical protein
MIFLKVLSALVHLLSLVWNMEMRNLDKNEPINEQSKTFT